MFKKLIEGYRNRYYISPVDLADYAETNRLHLMFISPFLFAFGVIMLTFFTVVYRHNLGMHSRTLLYYGLYIIISIYIFVHSRLAKNVAKEKAFVLKTIPFYVSLLSFLGAEILFFFRTQPFNSLISCGIIGIIVIYLFSFSPFMFLLLFLTGAFIMAPDLVENYRLSGCMNVFLAVILMFCLTLYKRRIEKKFIMLLKKQKQSLEAKTFGTFTLLYNNTVIKFSSTKSEELLAYLIFKNGSSVKTKELISVLYGKNADSSRYGASLRNLIVDIKHTLSELEIQNFFITEYNNFRINPEVIKCDYYDFLAGDSVAKKSFAGDFMSSFDWAQETTEFLKQKLIRK